MGRSSLMLSPRQRWWPPEARWPPIRYGGDVLCDWWPRRSPAAAVASASARPGQFLWHSVGWLKVLQGWQAALALCARVSLLRLVRQLAEPAGGRAPWEPCPLRACSASTPVAISAACKSTTRRLTILEPSPARASRRLLVPLRSVFALMPQSLCDSAIEGRRRSQSDKLGCLTR